jgi:hypothetical protein
LENRFIEMQPNIGLKVVNMHITVSKPGLAPIPRSCGEKLIAFDASSPLVISDDDHLTC